MELKTTLEAQRRLEKEKSSSKVLMRNNIQRKYVEGLHYQPNKEDNLRPRDIDLEASFEL